MRRHLLLLCLLFAVLPAQAFASVRQDSHEGKEEGKEGHEGKNPAQPRIDMDPFNFTLFAQGRVVGQVTIALTLVVPKSSDLEFVRLHQPQVRSDMLTALTSLARQRFDVSHPIDPDLVSAFLTPYADARLGQGKVQVYVKQALITPN